MKKFFIILCLIICGCQKDIGYKQISSNEALEIINNNNNYIILDVRTCDEYNSGHIKGAICIPNESISSSLDYVETMLPDKDQMILVYCRSGNRSIQAASQLVELGYTNIVEFGGIQSYQGEIVIE